MKYRANLSPFHGRRHVGDFPTFEASADAASCSRPGTLDDCRCGGGSVVAILETDADRALVAATADGMRYAYVPGDFGVTLPLPFIEAEGGR